MLWDEFAIYCIPGKYVVLARLRDPEKPFKTVNKDKGTRKSQQLDYSERVMIYDAFGFFQTSLVNALKDFPDVVTDAEYKFIEQNKDKRSKFDGADIEEIKVYTGLELKALVRMLDVLRKSLRDAIPGRPIELEKWYGAGSIASSLLESYLGKAGREHL
jgi:hypothetical protein